MLGYILLLATRGWSFTLEAKPRGGGWVWAFMAWRGEHKIFAFADSQIDAARAAAGMALRIDYEEEVHSCETEEADDSLPY
jgi:hypothetical protein